MKVADIFVSYARVDRDRVWLLVKLLEEEGFSIWWDSEIRPGEEFDEIIGQELKAAKFVIAVWSRVSVNSHWVKEEAEDGMGRGILVPVLFDPVEPPLGFRRIQAADLTVWQGEQSHPEIEALIARLKGKDPAPRPVNTEARKGRGRRFRPAGLAAGALALVLMLASLLLFTRDMPRLNDFLGLGETRSGIPTVLGIYPSNAFGPLHRQGLHAALETEARILRIIDLEAPIEDMKTNSATGLLKRLETLLKTQNVVGVVGPPITEFTKSVIKVIEATGRPMPVFITSATSRRAAGWDDTDVALFRIGSGIDERAAQFAGLAHAAIARDIRMVFLVERYPNTSRKTYGEHLFDAISGFIPQWRNWTERGFVARKQFNRGDITSALEGGGLKRELEQHQIIFFLGLGGDFKTFVTQYYKADSPRRAALLGGWMNAYAVNGMFSDGAYQWDRLFEVTDLEVSQLNISSRPEYLRFVREFGMLNIAMRDQAVSYDSGTILMNAFHAIHSGLRRDRGPDTEILIDDKFLEAMTKHLRANSFHGVSGSIHFNQKGQNVGSKRSSGILRLARFDGQKRIWREFATVEELLKTFKLPSPSEH